MDTFVLEHKGRVILTSPCHVVDPTSDEAAEMAAHSDWSIAADTDASPFLKWIAGDYAESDRPNSNNQMWTAADLASSFHSVRFAPLNLVHKTRQPIGFFADSQTAPRDETAATEIDPIKIRVLAGMWTHIFPFEAALVDQADAQGALFFSMECRGEKIRCAGDEGCQEVFDYLDTVNHCEHLKERASVRHIINPVFRGGALIVPPVSPGWKNATAEIITPAVEQEAARFAEFVESQDAAGSELTEAQWNHLMATILSLA